MDYRHPARAVLSAQLTPRSCTDLVLGTGISRVVIAWLEPVLFVADAQGRERLDAAGVEVAELEDLSGRARNRTGSFRCDAPPTSELGYPGTTVSGKGPYGRVIAGVAAATMRW